MARHLSGSAILRVYIGMPEWALRWFPLGLGLVVEGEPSEHSCTCMYHVHQVHVHVHTHVQELHALLVHVTICEDKS